MSFYVIRLHSLIENMGEERTSAILSKFKCSAEPDAEKFLRETSIVHEKDSISRTYLMVEKDDSGNYYIKGFFTLAVKCFTVKEERKDDLPQEIYNLMNVNKEVAQAYLLGQLAKADGVENGFGKDMIGQALSLFREGQNMFGCRVVRLDCKHEPKLTKYYESCGFTLIGKNPDGKLNQMIMVL